MDRRQKKTREAIFNAFCSLLSRKSYSKITVSDIIEAADVGRATFYSHFETKDFLLKELCEELFQHIFHSGDESGKSPSLFKCDAPSSEFLHLLRHLEKNDRHILDLLVSENNGLFLRYFKENLKILVKERLPFIETEKKDLLPEDFLVNHVAATFVDAVIWWIDGGMKESPEALSRYFALAI